MTEGTCSAGIVIDYRVRISTKGLMERNRILFAYCITCATGVAKPLLNNIGDVYFICHFEFEGCGCSFG
jgi:hypothetical protein